MTKVDELMSCTFSNRAHNDIRDNKLIRSIGSNYELDC
jgi:hypothetical protein